MRLGRPTDLVRFDLDDRPTRRVERGAIPIAVLTLPFGVFFAGFPVLGVVEWASKGELGLEALGLLPFFLVGLAALAFGVDQLTARRVVEIDVDEVRVRERRFLRERSWREPLSAYRGVRRRQERPPVRRNQPGLVLFCVDLVHPDRRRTIEVHRTRTKARWRDAAEDAASALGVPLLEDRVAVD